MINQILGLYDRFVSRLAFIAVLGAFVAASPAGAEPLRSLVIAEAWPELERQARERLAADPADGPALYALGQLAINDQRGSNGLRHMLLPQIENCIANRPRDSLCQLAYGQVAGVLLHDAGLFDALGGVDKVRAALVAAADDDPENYDATESLIIFYLQAPGIVGGSKAKARDKVEAFSRIDARHAPLLQALIALSDDDAPVKAEAVLAALQDEMSDPDISRLAARRWLDIGRAWMARKQQGRAEAAFRRAIATGAPSVVEKAKAALGLIQEAKNAG